MGTCFRWGTTTAAVAVTTWLCDGIVTLVGAVIVASVLLVGRRASAWRLRRPRAQEFSTHVHYVGAGAAGIWAADR